MTVVAVSELGRRVRRERQPGHRPRLRQRDFVAGAGVPAVATTTELAEELGEQLRGQPRGSPPTTARCSRRSSRDASAPRSHAGLPRAALGVDGGHGLSPRAGPTGSDPSRPRYCWTGACLGIRSHHGGDARRGESSLGRGRRRVPVRRQHGFTDAGEAAALRAVAEWAGGDVLDIGVGGGRTTGLLASSGPLLRRRRPLHRDARRGPAPAPGRGPPRWATQPDLAGLPDAAYDLVVFSYNGLDALDHAGRARGPARRWRGWRGRTGGCSSPASTWTASATTSAPGGWPAAC